MGSHAQDDSISPAAPCAIHFFKSEELEVSTRELRGSTTQGQCLQRRGKAVLRTASLGIVDDQGY